MAMPIQVAEIGHLAPDQEARQDGPKDDGVAERRDHGDVAGAHGDDDPVLAAEQSGARAGERKHAPRATATAMSRTA